MYTFFSSHPKNRAAYTSVLLLEAIFLVLPWVLISSEHHLTYKLYARVFSPSGDLVETWHQQSATMASMRCPSGPVTTPRSYHFERNGTPHGIAIAWHPGGARELWKEDIGLRITLYTFQGCAGEFGPLAALGEFSNGKRIGWWNFYNPDLSFDETKSGLYENDVLVQPGRSSRFEITVAIGYFLLLVLLLLVNVPLSLLMRYTL